MPAGRVRMGAGLAVALLVDHRQSAWPPPGATARPDVPLGQAAAADAPGPCPITMAQSAITDGKVGTGWTVTTGDTPRAFRVRGPGHARGRHRARPRPHHHQGQRPAREARHQPGWRHLVGHVGVTRLHRRQARGRHLLRLLGRPVAHRGHDASTADGAHHRLLHGRGPRAHVRPAAAASAGDGRARGRACGRPPCRRSAD